MKRYTINHHPVKTVEATLIHKQVASYHPNPISSTDPESVYELKFQTDKEVLEFEIDAFGYQVIPKDAKGELTYQGYELISFGSWYPVKK